MLESYSYALKMKHVLFYIPNIIDYTRLVILLVAVINVNQPGIFISLYTLSIILDAFDGYAARKLNQTSVFGAWLDVVIDIISRGFIWTFLYKHLGYVVACLEWIAFVSTHSRGKQWKSTFETAPWIVRQVFRNGFYSPLGSLAMAGLDILPIYLFCYHTDLLTYAFNMRLAVQYSWLVFLVICRLICMTVEVYVIADYVVHLTRVK